jgi:large repetitive protein
LPGGTSVRVSVRAISTFALGAVIALGLTTQALAAPAAPLITSPSSYSWVSTSTLTVSGTAETGSTVELFVDSVSRGTATATGGSWSRSPTAIIC